MKLTLTMYGNLIHLQRNLFEINGVERNQNYGKFTIRNIHYCVIHIIIKERNKVNNRSQLISQITDYRLIGKVAN